jgi:hypothetical protein
MIFPFMARNTGMLDGEFDMMRHRYNLNGGGVRSAWLHAD